MSEVLLTGGPYSGTRVPERMDANGRYLVTGAYGAFLYKFHHRDDEHAIAVPFDASEPEINAALFRRTKKRAASQMRARR